MNEKSSVSKELNTKHAKILEALVKQPENRECADCQSKAPRWASINLGIFICMQCSGIHRSLGVHISKVRSTTLDTWLPEQVEFMQMVGNKRSNDYWEAELLTNYDRSPIDRFIHSKYVDKKWASKTSAPPTQLVIGTKSGAPSGSGIPKKARKYSLEEDFFNDNNPQIVAPIIRTRGASLDLNDIFTVPATGAATEINTASTSVDGTADLFSLLYDCEDKKDRTVVPPSRWATFECKFHGRSSSRTMANHGECVIHGLRVHCR